MALDVVGPARELEPGGDLRRISRRGHGGLIRIDRLPRALELPVHLGLDEIGLPELAQFLAALDLDGGRDLEEMTRKPMDKEALAADRLEDLLREPPLPPPLATVRFLRLMLPIAMLSHSLVLTAYIGAVSASVAPIDREGFNRRARRGRGDDPIALRWIEPWFLLHQAEGH